MIWGLDPMLVFLLTLFCIIVGLSLFVRGQDPRDIDLESYGKLIYKTTVGGHINMLSSQFIGLRLYEDRLILSPLESYILLYAEIESIDVYKPFGLELGVEIRHHHPQINPKRLLLSTMYPRRIVEVVRAGMKP